MSLPRQARPAIPGPWEGLGFPSPMIMDLLRSLLPPFLVLAWLAGPMVAEARPAPSEKKADATPAKKAAAPPEKKVDAAARKKPDTAPSGKSGTAPEKKADTGAGKKPDTPATTKPAPAPKAPWKVIDFRGQAYLGLAEVAAFFDFPVYKKDGKDAFMEKEKIINGEKFLIQFRGQAGSKLVSLNKLKFYLSYPLVAWKDGQLIISAFDLIHVIDPILRPDQQREPSELKVIILDPARGGKETGISTRLGVEKDVTLEVALQAKSLLEKKGYRVVLTRDTDTAMPVADRLRLANQESEEAVFISLHCSYGSEREKGMEMFTLSPSGTPSTTGDEGKKADDKFYPGNINDRESMALATALQGTLVSEVAINDLGIRRARFDELKGIRMPAVVCSVGRLAHPEEGKKLGHDPAYRRTIAAALADGVDRYARVMAAGSPGRDRALKFRSVEATPIDDSAGGQTIQVKAVIAKSKPETVIDPDKVTLQIYFLDFVNDEEIDLSSCDTPKVTWVSVMPDWKQANYEEVVFTYSQPPFDGALAKNLGRRTYYGYVLRLIYGDELMDEHAEPANVRRGLGNFTAVLPRRK